MQLVCGWDPMLGSFFFQVFEDGHEDPVRYVARCDKEALFDAIHEVCDLTNAKVKMCLARVMCDLDPAGGPRERVQSAVERAMPEEFLRFLSGGSERDLN